MSIAAVVLNYNNYIDTKECVNLLNTLAIFDKLIIVDNASTDSSKEKLEKEYQNNDFVVLLSAASNKGYAAGNNLGLKYACETLKIDFTMICNPDVRIFEKKVIEGMIRLLETRDDTVSVAPKMLDKNECEIMNAWKIPRFVDDCILSSVLLTKIFGNKTQYRGKRFNDVEQIEVEVLSGACFVIKNEFIKQIGYLDEGTFLYGEERILAKQIQAKGWKQILLNTLYFHHLHSTTINKNIKSKVKQYKILSFSRYYYQTKYNEITTWEKIIFKMFTFFGVCEQIIIQGLKKIII